MAMANERILGVVVLQLAALLVLVAIDETGALARTAGFWLGIGTAILGAVFLLAPLEDADPRV